MDIFRFLDWQVYKDSKALFKLVYGIVSKLPKDVRYELGNQIIRSSFSVILNISEGSGKSSDRELGRYFDISIGSPNETVAGMDILMDNKLITEEDFNLVFQNAEGISKQLGGFKKKLWFFRKKVEVRKLSILKFRNYNEIKRRIEFQPYLV